MTAGLSNMVFWKTLDAIWNYIITSTTNAQLAII